MTKLDFAPLYRSTIGFDNVASLFDTTAAKRNQQSYPPYNIQRLDENSYKNVKRPPGDISFLLVQRFGELIRKLWNPKNFKAHVSPHEMLQAVVLCSKKKFVFFCEQNQVWCTI